MWERNSLTLLREKSKELAVFALHMNGTASDFRTLLDILFWPNECQPKTERRNDQMTELLNQATSNATSRMVFPDK